MTTENLKFNPVFVKETILKKLIPEGFEQRRMANGRFVLSTKWAKGELKRIALDTNDISEKLNLNKVQEDVEKILKTAKRFRHNYKGKIEFVVTIEESQIVSLYCSFGNYIITKDSERFARK